MTRFPVSLARFYLACLGLFLPFIGVQAQSVGELLSYTVVPSCESPDPNKPTLPDQYYLEIVIDSMTVPEGDFEIQVDRTPFIQFHIDQSDIPYQRFVGPFNHSGVGGSFHEFLLTSLDNGVSDSLFLPEVVCARFTHNGLNRPGYYCEGDNFGVVAQVSPEELSVPEIPFKTYVYVLLDRSTKLVVDRNFSGHFSHVEDLVNYEVHAFAVSFEMQAEFINNVVIGEMLDQDDLNVCYGLCGIYDVRVDCSSFDLSLDKTVQGGFVYQFGDLVTFDMTITNEGLVTAYDIVVHDEIPLGLEFLPGLNPQWNEDGTSLPVDSILAGDSHVIPLTLRVTNESPDIDIINQAEIIFATNLPGRTIAAFDRDSRPGNNMEGEDDRDSEEIIILENLCAATFEIDAGNEPVCVGNPLVLMANVIMGEFPMNYTWRLNGDIVSRDSVYVVERHGPQHYGVYSLTVRDANNCTGTEFITIEPILNEDRFSCISDIYVGVNAECSARLLPEYFTSRNVSAINDYTIDIRDDENNPVDLGDLSRYGPGTILEARIINPCTNEVLCWSNLHLEHKSKPTFEYYSDQLFEIPCPKIGQKSPTEIIDDYNIHHPDALLSASDFAGLLNQEVCLQSWNVDIVDQLGYIDDLCSPYSVRRIYFVFDQEQRWAIDTAVLLVKPIEPDSIIIPGDIDNISCEADISPGALNSFPGFYHGDSLLSLQQTYNNPGTASCNIAISYVDQDYRGICQFGASKVVRKWTIVDWCSTTIKEGIQHLFINDREAPEIQLISDLVEITTLPFACFASVPVYDYLVINDFCDTDPLITINGIESAEATLELALGLHDVLIAARDRCGNKSEKTLQVRVKEQTPPTAILHRDLSVNLSYEADDGNNFITASNIDNGSHDFDCGNVLVTIARTTEIQLLATQNNSVGPDYDLHNCMSDLTILDKDLDEVITRSELFRERIQFCCQDIGTTVMITVKVTDQSGNYTEAEVGVYVDAKLSWTACDDLDECTENDRQYGDCPCIGTPIITDIDEDLIIDCIDDFITVCLNEVQLEIEKDSLEYYLNLGAEGGACEDGAMANIGGIVYTNKNEMVEDVLITINGDRTEITTVKGSYMFENNRMYERYELLPERNDDPDNGVSTLDLVLIQDHLLGLQVISDPYDLIAADVNNDGNISALDIVEIRKLLLGQIDQFTHNNSWRFVLERFDFDDIRKPFNYQEIDVISNLSKDEMDENWIGVKIGDVNGTVIPNAQKSLARSSEEWSITIPEQTVKKGDQIKIPIGVSSKSTIRGFQLGIQMDGLEFIAMESGQLVIESSQFNVRSSNFRTDLSIVWHDQEFKEIDQTLFYLVLKAQKDGSLNHMVSLQNSLLNSLVSFVNYSEVPITLSFEDDLFVEIERVAKLHQNQPNPFNGETIIQFYIPEKDKVKLSFYDSNGRLLLEIEDRYHKGINAIRLTHSDLSMFEGVVYYQLQYKDQSLSRRMVISN